MTGVENSIGAVFLHLEGLVTSSERDLLAPTPTLGHLIGYARTSRRNQNLDRQIAALTAAGCKRIYRDQLSGRDAA